MQVFQSMFWCDGQLERGLETLNAEVGLEAVEGGARIDVGGGRYLGQ